MYPNNTLSASENEPSVPAIRAGIDALNALINNPEWRLNFEAQNLAALHQILNEYFNGSREAFLAVACPILFGEQDADEYVLKKNKTILILLLDTPYDLSSLPPDSLDTVVETVRESVSKTIRRAPKRKRKKSAKPVQPETPVLDNEAADDLMKGLAERWSSVTLRQKIEDSAELIRYGETGLTSVRSILEMVNFFSGVPKEDLLLYAQLSLTYSQKDFPLFNFKLGEDLSINHFIVKLSVYKDVDKLFLNALNEHASKNNGTISNESLETVCSSLKD